MNHLVDQSRDAVAKLDILAPWGEQQQWPTLTEITNFKRIVTIYLTSFLFGSNNLKLLEYRKSIFRSFKISTSLLLELCRPERTYHARRPSYAPTKIE
jgi:hypothetical protein